MPEALPHPDQEKRLAALNSYDILDTDPEIAFDDITAFAAQLCGTPIAVINLIDAKRQWFKAEIGLGVRETPLATSLCAHAILEDEFVEIADTHQDLRLMDNVMCTSDPGLRFYAGALLKTREGLPLGTLCVLDYQPRQLSPLQQQGLQVLARQVMAQLDLRKSVRHAVLLRQEVDHRVKNSLQTLSSFVRLAKRSAVLPETEQSLSVIQARIQAMANVHERLYRQPSVDRILLVPYLSQLAEDLTANAPGNVRVVTFGDDTRVDPGKAVALGTLVTEFSCNAFKHGFRDGRGGRVWITLRKDEDGRLIRLTCSDDGIGSGSVGVDTTGGLGMQVAQVLVSELSGSLDVQSGPDGFTVTVAFPADI